MIFNSLEYALFLPVVFFLYWFVFDRWMSKSKNQLRWQNAFLFVSVIFFRGGYQEFIYFQF